MTSMTFARAPRLAALIGALAMSVLAACTTKPAETSAAAPAQPVAAQEPLGLYELRIYTAAEGKMDALHSRFRDHTTRLFEKHGMTNIAYFSPIDPADGRLIYILGYKDRAARDASWRAFATDPAWTAVYQASQANGSLTSKIENVFMTPAEYFPSPRLENGSAPRVFELRTYTATPGKLENVHNRFKNHTIDLFTKHGLTSIAYFRPDQMNPAFGNKMTYILSFPSAEARGPAFRAFATDPEWVKVAADSEKDGPILAQPNAIASTMMKATDYSPLK
ncbi:NIPSNAP family protein [bacterium]|nr:NIPSNAP family protein [bacterium]